MNFSAFRFTIYMLVAMTFVPLFAVSIVATITLPLFAVFADPVPIWYVFTPLVTLPVAVMCVWNVKAAIKWGTA